MSGNGIVAFVRSDRVPPIASTDRPWVGMKRPTVLVYGIEIDGVEYDAWVYRRHQYRPGYNVVHQFDIKSVDLTLDTLMFSDFVLAFYLSIPVDLMKNRSDDNHIEFWERLDQRDRMLVINAIG